MKEKLNKIRQNLKQYIIDNNLKSLIIGESGGIDSAITSVIVREICDELDIPLIGAWIGIDGNKEDEHIRGINICKYFCHMYYDVNLTNEYNVLNETMSNPLTSIMDDEILKKNEVMSTSILNYDRETFKQNSIRKGNIKARLRMIYLRNLAQFYNGVVLNTDNKTERNLGFWTICGDDFDINLLIDWWKTDVYKLANYISENELIGNAKIVFDECINAVPTDGLGITNSDLDQFDCDTYDEVDEILKTLLPHKNNQNQLNHEIEMLKHHIDEEKIFAVWNRHLNSEFKRKLPIYLGYQL